MKSMITRAPASAGMTRMGITARLTNNIAIKVHIQEL